MSHSEQSAEALESAYKRIKELYSRVDSLNVVKEVDKYRNYWRPSQTNVILLAESHVYTSDEDFKTRIDHSGYEDLIPNYPDRYVRFVYCFGYAEHSLLKDAFPDMKSKLGTPQFWKIFTVCESENSKFDFDAIKKTTTETDERIKNKISLLTKLKKKGIWLVDGSIAGLYNEGKKPPLRIMQEILRTSWDYYVKELVLSARPKYVMCIGKSVRDTLNDKIAETNIPHDYIHQPQAHLTSGEREKEYKKLQRICSKHCT
jgi:hypothetical protein